MTVYYVAPNGLDSNPGTLSQPWLTVAKAQSVAKAGDTVYFRAGTYNETLSPANSGTSSAWITFSGYPQEEVILDATGLSFGRTGIVFINGKSFISVDHMYLQNARVNSAGGIFIYGASHDINIQACTIQNVGGPGIYAMYDWVVPPSGVISNITVDGCEVADTNYDGLDEAISFRQVDNFQISNCIVHDTHGQGSSVGVQKEGITTKVKCSNGLIFGNEVYNTKVGIYPSGTNISVYNNVVHNIPYDGIAISDEEGYPILGLNIFNNIIFSCNRGITGYNESTSRNFKVYNNTTYMNVASELIFWGSGYNGCVIANNIVVGPGGYSPLLSAPSGAIGIIDHNLFYTTGGYPTGDNYGTNAIKANPMLVNPPSDCSLQPSSPAINAGNNSYMPAFDFMAVSRPQGSTVDIGAYEYGGALTGTIVFNYSPPNAVLIVSDVQVGNNGVYTDTLPSGFTHTWQLTAPGYSPQFGIFSIVSGQTTTVNAALEFSLPAPKADFSVSTNNLMATFSDTSTNEQSGCTFEWDFGD